MPASQRAGSGRQLEVRRARPDDRGAIVDLCRRSLGWDDAGTDAAFYSWKHDENPAGPSPEWVAVARNGDVVGVRVFLRWRFQHEGRSFVGVRAVDTATDAAWRGQGVFSRLTLGALPGLRSDGVDFVFNTPNAQSRPGYLKMGWQPVGRVPVGVRFRPGAFRHLRSIRTPADRWGQPTDVGVPVLETLGEPEMGELLERLDPRPGIATDVSLEWLRWRYRFAPLGYRSAPLNGEDPTDGVVLFRLRNRGPALECTVCEVLAPPGAKVRRFLGQLLERTGADMMLLAPGHVTQGVAPMPLGPMLTWRPICRLGAPQISELSLTMGDLELF